ncbi:MAG TPA: glycosyltransferase family 9 protein, partial [Pirellulales bacterium]
MLGDLLCAVPAFRALRAALPDANISLIGLPWAVEFARQYVEYFDDFIEFPGYPGLPERSWDPYAVVRFLADVQTRQFDLAIQMHGSGSFVNPLVSLFGARRTAGYFRAGEYCPDSETFLEYPGDLPEVRRHLRLAAFLGAPPRGEQLEFPLTAAGDVEARMIADAYDISPRKYICLHPGARYPSRRWPPAKFAAVANSFAGEISNVVITGTKSESPLADELISHLRIPAVNLIGRTDLGTLHGSCITPGYSFPATLAWPTWQQRSRRRAWWWCSVPMSNAGRRWMSGCIARWLRTSIAVLASLLNVRSATCVPLWS